MILYFADRHLNIIGQASTKLPKGLKIIDDDKTEDVETGVAVLEGWLSFSNIKKGERAKVTDCAAVGNYILRQSGDADKADEFYTIIDAEVDTKKHEVYIYAEDAGLDLLNEIVGVYEADKAYPIDHYINKFAYDSGFKIGVNEAADLSRKLSWDGESTATERLASVATQFDCELSYSFEIDNLRIKNKYINIHKERGKDIGEEVRLNRDVDSIIATTSIANLATALKVTGGTPEPEEGEETETESKPITLDGYKYDDGDFFLEGTYLKSRKAVERWSRYLAEDGDYTGHICKTFTYDTTSQEELCNRAVAELKKLCEIEVNYEVDITKLPENAKIGDRINIVDDDGGLYLSARILKLETSETKGTKKATLGEYLIKKDGIHSKVLELAEQFAKQSQDAARALAIARAAQKAATSAKGQVDAAVESVEEALQAVEEVAEVVETAKQSAAAAQKAADDAQAVVDGVEDRVGSLESTVSNAQAAAEQAQQAAAAAETKAEESRQSAFEAREQAAAAEEAANTATETAETAVLNADGAKTVAEQAKSEAATAKATADAAKLDAEQAEKDIDELSESLSTLSNTMAADYARKTDLTETEASLQSQISQNAAQIQSTVTKVTEVDETANNAAEQAAQAQSTAAAAQEQADKATEDAEAAQNAADAAALAATNAQSEADKAKAAAAAAQSVADKAEQDLEAAVADLATVQGRVDATEEEIAAAQQAVETAQAAADKAKADAADATSKANAAQTTANNAVTDAANAQAAANDAASKAALAQQTADAAKGDAAAAQAAADQAAATAAEAQRTADAAVSDAATAQSKANEAAAAATAAQTAADEADAKAQQAAADLAEAEQNLADVTSRVGATEEEVAAAQAAVETAQAAADKAKADAATAQQTADTAKTNAENAQTAADNAKKAADDAQAAADAAQQAADEAQAAVDNLAVRVTKAETDIQQTAEAITLLATKEEVTQALGGHYTKSETDAKIKVESDKISSTVSEVRTEIDNIEIGGRNLALNSAANYESPGFNVPTSTMAGENDYTITDEEYNGAKIAKWSGSATSIYSGPYFGLSTHLGVVLEVGQVYTVSAWLKADAQTTARNSSLAEGQTVISSAVDVGTNWRRVHVVFEATKTDGNICFYTAANATADAPYIYMCGIKIEKGNKATDWTPAPEDVAADTAAAKTEASEAQATADENAVRLTSAESVIEQLVDSISMIITDENGTSLFEQTSEGWSFNLADISNNLDNAQTALGELENSLSDTDSAVDVLREALGNVESKTAYINIGTDDNGSPCIELGKQGNDFIVRITNEAVDFFDGTSKVAYISNKSLYITKAVVTGELQIGSFVLGNRPNGNFGLQYKGGGA